MLEEMNAIRNSLAGTANMAADGWCVPMQTAYLFPEHPMAKEWGDFFEKCLEIYGVFYTRPEVRTFEGKGGRWVESLQVNYMTGKTVLPVRIWWRGENGWWIC